MRARLVVCNGGSLTTQQALLAGVPVLGIASNMDQFMSMAPLVAAQAGRVVRADRVGAVAVREAALALLEEPSAAAAAARLGQALQGDGPPADVFDAAVDLVVRPQAAARVTDAAA